MRIIRELLHFEPEGEGTNIAKALTYLNNVIKKRSIAFLLSDFIDQGYDLPLKVAARRHDLIGMHLFDIREKEMPNVGVIHANEAEGGKRFYLDTSDPEVRRLHKESFEENFKYFSTNFLKSGADIVSIDTSESYVNTLLQFFKKRGK